MIILLYTIKHINSVGRGSRQIVSCTTRNECTRYSIANPYPRLLQPRLHADLSHNSIRKIREKNHLDSVYRLKLYTFIIITENTQKEIRKRFTIQTRIYISLAIIIHQPGKFSFVRAMFEIDTNNNYTK